MSRSGPSGLVSKSILVFVVQSTSAVVGLVTTPLVALGLGAEHYGLFVLLLGLLGYSAVLNLGLSWAVTREIAGLEPMKDTAAIEAVLGTVLTVHSVIALVLMLALVGGRGWMAQHLLRVPTALGAMAERSLIILACAVPFATLIGLFNAALRGLQRVEVATGLTGTTNALFALGTVVLVGQGARLEMAFGLHVVLMAASAFVHWRLVRQLVPGLRIVFRLPAADLWRLFRFARFMMLNHVCAMALYYLDKLLVARLLSVGMVGYYAVPSALSLRVNALGTATADVAFPFASARLAGGEVEELRRAYSQAARMLGWLTMAPALATILFADDILRLWIDEAFATHGTWPLRLLVLGHWAIGVASLDAVCIEGSGRPRVTSLFMVVTGILSLAGIVTFTPSFGLNGTASSAMMALVILAGLDVWFCNRYVLGLPLSQWLRAVALPTVVAAALSTPMLLALRALPVGLAGLLVVLGASVATTLAVGYAVFLTPPERKSLLLRAGRVFKVTT